MPPIIGQRHGLDIRQTPEAPRLRVFTGQEPGADGEKVERATTAAIPKTMPDLVRGMDRHVGPRVTAMDRMAATDLVVGFARQLHPIVRRQADDIQRACPRVEGTGCQRARRSRPWRVEPAAKFSRTIPPACLRKGVYDRAIFMVDRAREPQHAGQVRRKNAVTRPAMLLVGQALYGGLKPFCEGTKGCAVLWSLEDPRLRKEMVGMDAPTRIDNECRWRGESLQEGDQGVRRLRELVLRAFMDTPRAIKVP